MPRCWSYDRLAEDMDDRTQSILSRLDFGNEAADDVDPEELAAYFVEQELFRKFLDERKRLLVAAARKGVGKSALLQWISHKVASSDSEALVIKVRGADLVRSKFNLTTSLDGPNDHIRDWTIRLCALVNRALASQIKLAIKDDAITLVETAELEGYKSRNLVGALLDRMGSVLDSRLGSVKKLPARNEIELLKRTKNRKVWIIIDDLDATFQNTTAESLNLATFFSACRYMTQDLKDVFIRVSMRSDVWALLRRFDEALDKMEQYIFEIEWRQRDFLQLLSLRVKASLESAQISLAAPPAHVSDEDAEERLLEFAFVPKMQWGKSGGEPISAEYMGRVARTSSRERFVASHQVIFTLSYERPRWAIQLCKLAQQAALRRFRDRIDKESIDEVWGEYGAKRIADLVSEHKHQCPELEELLNGFRGCDRLMTRDRLFDWIKRRITEHIEPHIEGVATRSARDIARFLYRLGFIVARSDDTQSGNYEHYRFDQMPDFLTARTDEDFSLKWEIHPCYREALDIKKLDRSHMEKFRRLRQIR